MKVESSKFSCHFHSRSLKKFQRFALKEEFYSFQYPKHDKFHIVFHYFDQFFMASSPAVGFECSKSPFHVYRNLNFTAFWAVLVI
jgi:hypothetical protein